MGIVGSPESSGRTPRYLAVASELEQMVAELAAHEGLPAEERLRGHFGVSRATIRSAIGVLANKGLVYAVQGSGTYVAPKDLVTKTLRLTSFSEDMHGRGLTPSSTTLSIAQVPATESLAISLDLEVGAELLEIRRLRLADGDPMALETVHLPVDLLTWEGVDLDGSLYAAMELQGVRIDRAAQTVEAVNLDPQVAHLLQLAVGAAALRVRRVSRTERGQPVESAETLYRGDRYGFDIVVARDAP